MSTDELSPRGDSSPMGSTEAIGASTTGGSPFVCLLSFSTNTSARYGETTIAVLSASVETNRVRM